MHEYVATLERYVWALQLSGSPYAEQEITENLLEILQDRQVIVLTDCPLYY